METEFENMNYECAVVAKVITWTQETKVRRGKAGARDVRIPAGFACSSRDECPAVATRHGVSTTFDWSQCAYRRAHGLA